MIRKRIFEIIEQANREDSASRAYDIFIFIVIILSLVPLMCMEEHWWTALVNNLSFTVFLIDYLLRLFTADHKLSKGKLSFVLYPFTYMAIVDLLSILPYVTAISNAYRVLRITRIILIFRLFKTLRYSSKFRAFIAVLKNERQVLFTVLAIAVIYIFSSALILFNVEPHVNPYTGEPTFKSFFDALYWATVTLTTVGYGDMCPVTDTGRMISMLSSLFGVAIIALPSGVITASYLEELRKGQKE